MMDIEELSREARIQRASGLQNYQARSSNTSSSRVTSSSKRSMSLSFLSNKTRMRTQLPTTILKSSTIACRVPDYRSLHGAKWEEV